MPIISPSLAPRGARACGLFQTEAQQRQGRCEGDDSPPNRPRDAGEFKKISWDLWWFHWDLLGFMGISLGFMGIYWDLMELMGLGFIIALNAIWDGILTG